MKRALSILAGFLCLFIAAGLLLPAYAKLTNSGVPKELFVYGTVGILIAASGIIVLFKGVFPRRKIQ
ncbi:MAG TPA: hypothetical protein VF773_11580 [Verrucomicrobiae bacterium]